MLGSHIMRKSGIFLFLLNAHWCPASASCQGCPCQASPVGVGRAAAVPGSSTAKPFPGHILVVPLCPHIAVTSARGLTTVKLCGAELHPLPPLQPLQVPWDAIPSLQVLTTPHSCVSHPKVLRGARRAWESDSRNGNQTGPRTHRCIYDLPHTPNSLELSIPDTTLKQYRVPRTGHF